MFRTISFGTGQHEVKLEISSEGKAHLEVNLDEDHGTRTDDIDLDEMIENLEEFVAFAKNAQAKLAGR